MLTKPQFWILTALASVIAVLILANMYVFSANRTVQNDVSQRALFIQQTVPLETLSRDIALALAQLSVRSEDAQIRSLLTSLGININVNAPGQPAPKPGAAETGTRAR